MGSRAVDVLAMLVLAVGAAAAWLAVRGLASGDELASLFVGLWAALALHTGSRLYTGERDAG